MGDDGTEQAQKSRDPDGSTVRAAPALHSASSADGLLDSLKANWDSLPPDVRQAIELLENGGER